METQKADMKIDVDSVEGHNLDAESCVARLDSKANSLSKESSSYTDNNKKPIPFFAKLLLALLVVAVVVTSIWSKFDLIGNLGLRNGSGVTTELETSANVDEQIIAVDPVGAEGSN